MALITIFTSPKPFTDPHINEIQRNAILSWIALGDEVEVLLLGDEEGLGEFAAEFGIRQIKDIKCNELGTPLVSSLFDTARENSNTELLAYVNADIILLPDFISTSKEMLRQQEKFLLVGQRYDLDITEELNFDGNWKKMIEDELKGGGRLHPPSGSDYFIYTRNVYLKVPDFTIGRAGWDNWFIYHAVTQPWMAIDVTGSITVVHQNHDYSHLPGKKPHYDQPETFENIKLADGRKHMYFLYDVDQRIINLKISKKKYDLNRVLRAIERLIYPSGVDPKGFRWRITLWLIRFRNKMASRK